MDFLGCSSNKEPTYQVPVGCEDSAGGFENASPRISVKPYEITTVAHAADKDLRRLSSKYILPKTGQAILDNTDASGSFELQNITYPKENDYYHIYENGDINYQENYSRGADDILNWNLTAVNHNN